MKIYLIIIFMAIVTYVPRVLPMFFVRIDKVPPKLKKFLYFIPYAALGALIFPGGLTALGNYFSSFIALIATIIISLFIDNIVIIVFISVAIAYFISFILY